MCGIAVLQGQCTSCADQKFQTLSNPVSIVYDSSYARGGPIVQYSCPELAKVCPVTWKLELIGAPDRPVPEFLVFDQAYGSLKADPALATLLTGDFRLALTVTLDADPTVTAQQDSRMQVLKSICGDLVELMTDPPLTKQPVVNHVVGDPTSSVPTPTYFAKPTCDDMFTFYEIKHVSGATNFTSFLN